MAFEWISRDQVVAALDMGAVLAHYNIEPQTPHEQGSSFRIRCPFHEDERPSCSVNTNKKVYNCFSCGDNGNILDFIAGMEELDPKAEFRTVLEKAIEIIGHNPTPQKGQRRKEADGGANRNNDEQNIAPKKSKKRSKKAKAKKKSKQRSTTKDGSLDLEPNRVLEGPAFPLKLDRKHPWLDAQLKRIGVNRSVAAEFGIGYERRSNALMANRVCFPLYNSNGDLVAYAGRWASDDADEQGRFFTENGREQPRYRLPKGFHKQLELFNWHRVQEQFEDTKTIVLVEGFWSTLRLQAMTIPCVALMGLSISEAQIRLLIEGGIRSVIVMLDGDDEGRLAGETLVPQLASHFFTRSVDLPKGKKPDDVDATVLNEVKALCVETSFESSPEIKPRQKPAAQKRQRQKKAKQVEEKRYTLPPATLTLPLATGLTARLNWNGLL